jgi:precorrin-2 dehydrogenase/sirohydrochlorin ferrochelatase
MVEVLSESSSRPSLAMNLVVRGRRAVIVGGGAVGRRKARSLLRAGADVVVVEPEATLPPPVDSGTWAHVVERFHPSQLEGASLVFAATDDPEVNREVASAARRIGALVNVADDPAGSDFHLPAVLTRGDLVIGVSTGGTCPGFSQVMKGRIEALLGDEVGLALKVASAARRWLIRETRDWADRSRYRPLVTDALFRACRQGDLVAIERQLAETLGPDCTLRALGLAERSVDSSEDA